MFALQSAKGPLQFRGWEHSWPGATTCGRGNRPGVTPISGYQPALRNINSKKQDGKGSVAPLRRSGEGSGDGGMAHVDMKMWGKTAGK